MTVGLGDLSISKDLTHWINDGLMAVFFLVVGLEIKREVLVGELFSLWGAALPMTAALGGAVAPSRMTDSNALPAVSGTGSPLVS